MSRPLQGSIGRQDLEYVYEGALLTTINDKGTQTVTSYAYDLAGNHIREKTVATVDGKAIVAQDNSIEYDQQGRMTHVADGVFDVAITYDLNGNRIAVKTTSSDAQGKVSVIDARNTFDRMNRVLIANGQVDPLDATKVVMGTKGHEITYDKAGRRTSDTYWYTHAENRATLTTREEFSYDRAGRLASITRGDVVMGTMRNAIVTETREYDAAGRLSFSGPTFGVDEGQLRGYGLVPEERTYAYDAGGRMTRLKIFQLDGVLKDDLYYQFSPGLGNYDGVGNLLGYKVVPAKFASQTNFSYQYAKFDTYKELAVTGKVDATTHTVVSYFDRNGNLNRVVDSSGKNGPVTRTFINDASGRVLHKIDASGTTRTMIVNGEVFGTTGDGVSTDGFVNVYEPATSGANTAAPTIYNVASASETLSTIAKAVWGDANLWYLIADANGMDGGEALAAGQVLKLPARVNTIHDRYDTFKPYSVSDAVGNTTPAMPAPAGGAGGCGPVGMIVMVVVAIVVTF